MTRVRAALAAIGRGGYVRLGWSDVESAFRDDVRRFLAAALPEDLRCATRLLTSVYAPPEISLRWQGILYARGWAAPAWPIVHGGCGWTALQRQVFADELAQAEAPPLSPMGLGMLGPVLIANGTHAQKARYLPRILSGEDFWCQGYSEPQSGSDLASLRMQARDAGDRFICNGQKIWTTHAHRANWIFCLVRTATDALSQRGITFLLIDMASPGVEVRPITSIAGERIQAEVFFRDVAVPKENVVGRVGEGWAVAKQLMEFERGGRFAAPSLRVRLARLRAHAAGDPFASRKLAEAAVRIDCLEALELRTSMRVERGGALGLEASVLKVLSTELSQHLTELALDVAGARSAPFQPSASCPGGPVDPRAYRSEGPPVGEHWTWPLAAKYFNDRAGSIYGGSNEIQRNIIAKALVT